MRVLVTGSEGYIGSVLTPFLVSRGFRVSGMDTGFYTDGCLYPIERTHTTVRRDVRKIASGDLEGFDAVVHLAELSNDPLGQLSPLVTYEINHLGSVTLARMCREAGVPRFVYTSSCSVYGIGTGELMTEKSDVHPQTAYAECKVLVEQDVARLADEHFTPTFLRNATAFGPSPRMRFDIVLNNLAGLAWTARELKLTSNGSPWRPLVHVEDICEAIDCTLRAPADIVRNEIFNVGDTSQNYQVKDIAEIVSAVFTGCSLRVGQDDSDNRSYRVSFEKIKSQLPGFGCKRDAERGALELRRKFEEVGMARETFEFRAFTRVRQIQYLLETGRINEHLSWNENVALDYPQCSGLAKGRQLQTV